MLPEAGILLVGLREELHHLPLVGPLTLPFVLG